MESIWTKRVIGGALCFMTGGVLACTIGVVSGEMTVDGRPILFKNRDSKGVIPQALLYRPAETPGSYAFIGVGHHGSYPTMGLNEAGLATGNSRADDKGVYIRNPSLGNQTLERVSTIDEVRAIIDRQISLPVDDPDNIWVSGNFPYMDAGGRVTMFEVSKSKNPDIGIWYREYDPLDPKRDEQSLLGIVPRGNVFHRQEDGTDKVSLGVNYGTCRINLQGLRERGALDVRAIIQGNPDEGLEVLRNSRYGDSRDIARSWTTSAIVVHGVKAGEDAALTTMWALLGKPDYCIAVPAWVAVSNIPKVLAEGDLSIRSESLYNKGRREITHASIFPAETHLFEMVNTVFLPRWRANGVSASEMERVQHRMANDAYSLLACLDELRADNKAPVAGAIQTKAGRRRAVSFSIEAHDPDGSLASYIWDFGDGNGSNELAPVHTYGQSGTYLVSCTVEDNDKVSLTAWRYLTIR